MKYAIIRIKKTVNRSNNIIENCFEIHSKGYETLALAIEQKMISRNPEFYIIIQYFE